MAQIQDPRELLLVIGAGRSGTSLTTGVFGALGFHVPQLVVQPHENNPKGYFEPRWAVNWHAKLMKRYGIELMDARPSAWDLADRALDEPMELQYLRNFLTEQFSEAGRVVIKDPRTAYFLSMWTTASADLDLTSRFVTPVRHPSEVLSSVKAAGGKKQPEAVRAAWWIRTMLQAELQTRGRPRAYFAYEELLSDWRSAILRAEDQIGLPVLSTADPAGVAAVDALVDPSLRRSARGWHVVDVPRALREIGEATYVELLAMCSVGGDTPERRKTLDELLASYDELYAGSVALVDATTRATVTQAVERERERRRVRPGPRESDHPALARRVRRRLGRVRRRLAAGRGGDPASSAP